MIKTINRYGQKDMVDLGFYEDAEDLLMYLYLLHISGEPMNEVINALSFELEEYYYNERI